jgi:hypothetical protein
MGQETDELKRRVDAARSRLHQDINNLEYRVKTETDWRVHYERRPWAFLGAAFGGGLLLSLAFFGPRRA